jgi:adenosylcobinamide-phosphate synthase
MSEFIDSIIFILMGAVLLDLVMGDPRWLPHPVIGIGNLISYTEKRLNIGRGRKTKGIFFTIFIVGIVFLVTWFIVSLAYHVHPYLGILAEIYLISTTMAIKGLREAAIKVVVPLCKGDIVEARKQLSWIVGRDTEALPEPEVVRGTVETVAENTVDGITAPLFWAFIGGAPLALAYRAVNTLDSMVGYKNEKFLLFGWASARLDDVCNWVPAKVTSLCIWLSSLVINFFPLLLRNQGTTHRMFTCSAIQITLRDAPKHPSPNSGWSEAMVAGLLGIQLGGTNYYQGILSERARMGDPLRELHRGDIYHAITLMHGGWVMFLLLLITLHRFLLI